MMHKFLQQQDSTTQLSVLCMLALFDLLHSLVHAQLDDSNSFHPVPFPERDSCFQQAQAVDGGVGVPEIQSLRQQLENLVQQRMEDRTRDFTENETSLVDRL